MSLIAHWKLDSTSGTTAYDFLGVHNGSILGEASYRWCAGRIGNGLRVYGGKEYVEVAHHADFNLTTTFSIAFWTKMNSVAAGTFLSKYNWNTDDASYLVDILNSGRIEFAVYNGGDDGIETTAASIIANKWYHVACVFDNGHMYIYLNGSLNVDEVKGIASAAASTVPISLFRNSEMDQRQLDGVMDDVRVYNNALTDVEVLALYSAGIATGPEILELRTSGGDFTTGQGFFDCLGNANNPLPVIMCPLQQDVTLNVEGGAVFGAPTDFMQFDYGILTGESFNGHTVIIQTDPAERATPAALLGVFTLQKQNAETVESLFILKDLLLAREANQVRIVYENPNGKISIQIKNCVGYLRSASEDYVKIIIAAGVVTNTLINNSSFFATKSESQLVDIYPMQCGSGNLTGIIRNSFIGVCSVNSAITLHLYANAHNNNTVYDYRGVSVTVDLISGATTPDIVSDATDPLLTDAVIQAFDDSIPTMMARNAKQLASSGLVGTGDLATAETDDINGNSRP
jgi:hypothetical protein